MSSIRLSGTGRLNERRIANNDPSAPMAAAAPFPVRIHRNGSRIGYRANFMGAASLCQSELIAFCDQDDIWEPRKLALCLKPFADPEVLLVYHGALAVTAANKLIGPLEQRPERPMDYALGFAQIFHRSLLDASSLWPLSLDHKEVHREERMAHDQWFFFLASALGSIVRIDEPLVRYRQHGANAYGWGTPSSATALGRYLGPSFRGRIEEYAALERAAGRRGAILAQLAAATAGAWRPRASLAAEKYRFLETLYRRWRRLYESVSPIERAAAFGRILASRGYRSKQDWGFGGKALIADLCFGLVAGHRLSGTRERR